MIRRACPMRSKPRVLADHRRHHGRWGEVMSPLGEVNDAGIVHSTDVRDVVHLETAVDDG